MKRQDFTLVEIMIALALLGVGLVAVLGIFPIGVATTRDAMAESTATDAADQTLHMIRRMAKCSLPGHVAGGCGSACAWKTTIDDGDEVPPETDLAAAPESSLDFTPTADNYQNAEMFTGGTMIKKPGSRGIYKLIRYRQAGGAHTSHGEPYYKPDTDELDFEAIAVLWKSKSPLVAPDDPSPYSKAAVVNMEISWPAHLPPEKRTKATYSLELFNR